MNQNIKQLYDHVFEQAFNDDINQKFAEAIIKECARVCEELSFCKEGPSPQAKYQRSLCASAIKQHFGVH